MGCDYIHGAEKYWPKNLVVGEKRTSTQKVRETPVSGERGVWKGRWEFGTV